MLPDIEITLLSLNALEDPITPDKPCKARYSFSFHAEAEEEAPVTIFYCISKNDSNPEDIQFKMYAQDEILTIEEDEASIYYIIAEAFATNGQHGRTVIPVYFENNIEEEPVEEPEDTYDYDGPFTVRIFITNADEDPDELVENIPYTVVVEALSGYGTVKLLPDSLPSYVSLNDYAILNLRMGGDNIRSYSFDLMVGACHNGQGVMPVFSIEDDAGNTDTVSLSNYATVSESKKYPYSGMRVLWKKVSDATNYNIYRTSRPDGSMFIIASVPADTYGTSKYQWYIDRDGHDGDYYSVAPVNASGYTGEKSVPRTAPDSLTNACLLQGSVIDLGLKGVDEVPIAYRIKEMPSAFKSSLLIKSTNIVYTDERGFFEILLPQNSVVTIAIDDAGFKKSLVIPPLRAASLEDVLNMPQNLGDDKHGHYIFSR